MIDAHTHWARFDAIDAPADALLPWLQNSIFPVEIQLSNEVICTRSGQAFHVVAAGCRHCKEPSDASLGETESLIRRWHDKENRLFYAVVPRFVLTCGEKLLSGAGGACPAVWDVCTDASGRITG